MYVRHHFLRHSSGSKVRVLSQAINHAVVYNQCNFSNIVYRIAGGFSKINTQINIIKGKKCDNIGYCLSGNCLMMVLSPFIYKAIIFNRNQGQSFCTGDIIWDVMWMSRVGLLSPFKSYSNLNHSAMKQQYSTF